jgi:hypothetical protein
MDKQRLEEIKAELDLLFEEWHQFTYDALHPLVMCYDLLKAYEQATTWQDISTAPRDGTEMLLFEMVEIFEQDEKQPYMFTGRFETEGNHAGSFVCLEYQAFKHNPTHWMPRPKPPATEEE